MTDITDGSDSDKPVPSCPVCSTAMRLTVEQRDGETKRVWTCPRAREHEPYHWWRYGICNQP